MRTVSDHMSEVWASGNKVGQSRRPTVRATIQRTYQRRWGYDTHLNRGGTQDQVPDPHRAGSYTSVIFGNPNPVREVRNIKSCTWQRSVDQDIATCSITLLNSDVTPIGNPDEQDLAGFDQPGFFTFNRGTTAEAQNRWGHEENGWKNIFVPDALVKTYEGYGANSSVDPAHDENLEQTGTWLIDKVTYSVDGTITLEMRDLGRLLIDQIAFPPVIPFSEYPMSWERVHSAQVYGRDVTGGKWKQLKGLAKARSSNDYYIGRGLTNGDREYVDGKGGVYGHYASHALVNTDFKKRHYWMSTGQSHDTDFVWWQADLFDHTTALNGVRIQSMQRGIAYISLMGKHGWIGRKKIPYDATAPDNVDGVDIGADIPFVTKIVVDPATSVEVTLPRKYADIKKIRITYTHLIEASYGRPYPFHASMNDIQIYTAPHASSLGFHKGKVNKTVGNYQDYTDIVRYVCAWAGWWHPEATTGDDWIKFQGGDKQYIHLRKMSRSLDRGGLWGMFQQSHTYGIADLTADLFDKKPLMDMINYVRDLLGFLFFIDEVGAVVWRMPNIWQLGNYINANPMDPRELEDAKFHQRRTREVVVLDETNALLNYSTTLSSENIRERIFVANSTGKIGAVIAGYNPVPTNMRRMAGWTDQHFDTRRETVVMADMVAARAMFTYRRGQATIAGYPKIQVDDQVRIYERVTNETYYHYVMGITSTMDMEEGVWTYELDTHWLGEDPAENWVVDVEVLKPETQAYLKLLR